MRIGPTFFQFQKISGRGMIKEVVTILRESIFVASLIREVVCSWKKISTFVVRLPVGKQQMR